MFRYYYLLSSALIIKMFSSRESQSSSSEYSQSSTTEDNVSPLRPCNEPRLARPSYIFIGVLSQECPDYENCQGEIELWKNLKKNEVFVQFSGDCKGCRYSTKIATYTTCCVCGYGIVTVSTAFLYICNRNLRYFVAGRFDYAALIIESLGLHALQKHCCP